MYAIYLSFYYYHKFIKHNMRTFFWEKESPISELWCTILLKKINCDFHKIEQLCLGLLPNEIHGLWANGSATFGLPLHCYTILCPATTYHHKFLNCHATNWWFWNVLRLWTIDFFFTLSALNVVPIFTIDDVILTRQALYMQ